MYVLLVIGFVLLIKGADFFVEGSSCVARRLRIPSVVIGLTIVSIGTSAPEAAVSITAGLSGSNDLALSNVIGSNIFNVLMVIGVCALLEPFAAEVEILKRDLPVNIVATLVLLIFVAVNKRLDRYEGILLLAGLVVYLVVVVKGALKSRSETEAEAEEEEELLPVWQMVVYIIGGAAAIVWGGDLVVDSASEIAENFGMSQTLVGLTIVAVGTSLPELVTSIVASRKGESGLALGNAIGSCIFNILFILGMSAGLSPIAAEMINIIDIAVVLAIAVLVFIFGWTGKKITRAEGGFFVLCYVVYMAYAIMRNYGMIG
jgi:cation:H+ antiporter